MGMSAAAQDVPPPQPGTEQTESAAADPLTAAAPQSAPEQPAAQPTQVQPAVAQPAQAQPAVPKTQQDALVLYRRGRDLEAAGRTAEAQTAFAQSIAVCDKELAADSSRIEAYVVRGWSLFRLGRHAEVISNGQTALKVAFDARIVEVMGESYYFLERFDDCLRSLQKYIEVVGDMGDRSSTAYFYMAEAYLRLKRYAHADIAYSTAVKLEPTMPRWWYRLGYTCEQLGEWKRAGDAYAKALSLSPGYQDALDGQTRVKAKLTQ
jgi:tetratricopeptide (TPR) repeat protein